MKLQKVGGIAAIYEGLAFIIGLALYFTVLEEAGFGKMDKAAAEHIGFLAENMTLMYAWNIIIYVVFGCALVVLSLALSERYYNVSRAMSLAVAGFGLIWASLVIAAGMVANIGAEMLVSLAQVNPEKAEQVWYSLSFVTDGLGGGNEIVGGIWVVLISLLGLKTTRESRCIHYLGLIVGLSAVLTLFPPLKDLGAVFGLGMVVWFLWLGLSLFRQSL